MLDAAVKWEPFTLAGKVKVVKSWVINAPITVIPAQLQMCVECIHVCRIGFCGAASNLARNHNLSPTEAPYSAHSLAGAHVLHVQILEAEWNIWNVFCLSTNGAKQMVNHRPRGANYVPAENSIRQMEIYFCIFLSELRKVALGYNK